MVYLTKAEYLDVVLDEGNTYSAALQSYVDAPPGATIIRNGFLNDDEYDEFEKRIKNGRRMVINMVDFVPKPLSTFDEIWAQTMPVEEDPKPFWIVFKMMKQEDTLDIKYTITAADSSDSEEENEDDEEELIDDREDLDDGYYEIEGE